MSIAAALILLPALPLPRWSGASDVGPTWWPHVESWWIGMLVVVVGGLIVGRAAARAAPERFRWPASRPWLLVIALSVILSLAAAFAMHAVFARNPHLIDEMAQLLHARAYAAGSLALPPPEPPESFLINNTWLTDAGWVSLYPPGQTLLLAGGLLLGAEWLVNPFVGGLSVVLVFVLARGLFGVRTGLTAAFLWAASSWVLFMSATYMNHVAATAFALAAWALVWGPRRPGRWHWVAAGIFLALCAATRPLDAVAAAVPIGAWSLFRRRIHAVALMALGAVPVAIAWGYINFRLYGGPFTLGYTAVYGPEHGLGFHTDPWGVPYTPLVGISNMAVAIRRLYIYLYEWPIPALLPLALWALLARHRRWGDLVVALGIVAGPLLYILYWHSGFYPGPRFYYIAAPYLVIGLARAWRWAWSWARRQSGRVIRWDAALVGAAVIVLVWGWIALFPKRWEEYRASLTSLKHHPEQLIEAAGVSQALVIMPESWGSRIITNLWGLGVPPGLAEQVYRRVDACELHSFGERARRNGLPLDGVVEELKRLLEANPSPPPVVPGWPYPTLRMAPRASIPEECRIELARDLNGFTLYGNHAWRNSVRLDTGIVFARDLYERNDRLLARYPGWEVWRFAPPADDPEAAPVLRRVRPAAERTAGPDGS